ncbi:hypothetical protein JCM10296v2_007148 [Rhodotorula toruloides]
MPPKTSAAGASFDWMTYTVCNPLPGSAEIVVLDKKNEPIKWTRYASTTLAAIVLPSTAPAPASATVYDPRLNGGIPVIRYKAYRTQIVKALERGERVRTREEALAASDPHPGQAGVTQEEDEEDEEDQLDSSTARHASPELVAGSSTSPAQEEEADLVNDVSDEDEEDPSKPKIRFSRRRYLISAPLPNEQPVVVYDKSGNIVTEYSYSTDFKKIVLPRHVRARDKKVKMANGKSRKVIRFKKYKSKVLERLAAGKHVLTVKEALKNFEQAQTTENDTE